MTDHKFTTHKTYTGQGCALCGKLEVEHGEQPAPADTPPDAICLPSGAFTPEVLERVLAPSFCGKAGHFKFQQNGSSCIRCQDEWRIAADAVAAERERCAKAMCFYCRNVERYGVAQWRERLGKDWHWYHVEKGGAYNKIDDCFYVCQSEAIRATPASEPQPVVET